MVTLQLSCFLRLVVTTRRRLCRQDSPYRGDSTSQLRWEQRE